MRFEDIISEIENSKQALLRNEYNTNSLKEKINVLNDENLYKLDEYLVNGLIKKDFSIIELSRIRTFPRVKKYIENQLNIENDDSWLYAYHYNIYIYSKEVIPFFNFLYKLIDKKRFDIIEFNLYQIANIKNEGYVFLKCFIKLNENLKNEVTNVLNHVYGEI